MAHNVTLSIPASAGSADLELTGLSEAQEAACYAALRAFMERNRVSSWGLRMDLRDDGPRSQLEISVVAPREFDFQVRTSQFTVDKNVDVAEAVDLCLETHYNACMNSKAMSNPSAKLPPWQTALNR